MMNDNQIKLKKKIHLSRTYRRLKVDRVSQNLYLFLWVVPFLIIFLYTYSIITFFLTDLAYFSLLPYQSMDEMGKVYSDFLPYFGGVYHLTVPDVVAPNNRFIAANMIFSLIIFLVCVSGRRSGHPFGIFVSMAVFIHMVSCIYFVFAPDYFPYTNSDYSELYIKQQVGIWLSFLSISGFITAFLGIGSIFRRIQTFIAIMLYSFSFGIIRYIVFLFILSKVSVLYMALMFFSFGPFFDFLYLVYIYGLYVEKVISVSESQEGKGVWEWS
jgi:hypothetical protein